jgi:hypothetical protein
MRLVFYLKGEKMNCNTMYISSVTTTSTGVILVPNKEVKNVVNCGSYKMIIACNVEATANLPVFIQIASGNIPVLCKAGNEIYANQLQKRRCYSVMYGNQNNNYEDGQFVIQNCVSPRSA